MAASLLSVEFAIRVWDAVSGDGFASGSRNEIASHPRAHAYRGFGFPTWAQRDGQIWISSRYGELYPLAKPPGAVRIVCFGGSSSENRYAHRGAGIHYPQLLEHKLRRRLGREDVEVISVANSAFSTAQSLVVLAVDVVRWDPDVVILSHAINDQQASYIEGFLPDYSHKYQLHVPTLVPSALDVLFQHFQLYWVLKERLRRIGPPESPFVPAAAVSRRSYGPDPPAAARAAFARNLRSFTRLATAEGIAVVLASQPFRSSEEAFLRSMGLRTYLDVATYPLHDEFVRHHRAYNQTLLAVAEEEGVFGFDLEAAFGTDPALLGDSVHYTPAGVRRLAQLYASFLIERRIVSKRPGTSPGGFEQK